MSDLRYRVGVDGVSEAVSGLRSVGAATGAAGQAASAAGGGFGALGSTAQQAAQRLQGTASAVANLAGRLGAPDVATGASLIASVAGSTAQFAAMGSMLGPGGTLAGAVVGFAAGIVPQLISALSEVPVAQTHVATATERASAAFLAQATSAGRATQSIQDFVASLTVGGLRTHAREIADEITGLSDQLATLEEEGSRFFDAGQIMTERTRLGARIERLTAESASVQSEIEANTGTRRRSGGAGDDPESRRVAALERVESAYIAAGEQQRAFDDANKARAAEQLALEEHAAEAYAELLAEREELTRAAADAEIEAKHEQIAAQRDLNDAYDDGALAFGTGYVSSIDQVIASWRELERVQKTSTRSMMADGRLLERSLVAVGNNIAETIGSDMKGAFQDALGAWLDGSLSFVEAAERMAKGVIKALVTESIVQAIVEGARAIASIASQDYVGAASHAAAAAAWAAVGVVAGGVGAAVGAFGGGEGGSASASTADANRERDRDRDERGGATTYVIMPGGFITSKDVQRGIVQALNEAGRSGLYPNPAPSR